MAPIDYFDKFRAYYNGLNGKHAAVLSGQTSALLSMLFTLLYVVPFYLSRRTRPSPTLNRDAPSVIKARIQSVTGTVVLSTISTFGLLTATAGFPLGSALHYLGLYPIDLLSICKTLLLTVILYAAPLYETIYIDGDLSPVTSIHHQLISTLASWQGYRNYVIGPLTEELLFRSCFIPLHLLAHVSAEKIVFLTPLYFGIAHVHHFYEFRLTHPHTPLLPALLRSVFQFTYTSVFGWYAAFIYLRTGNLYAVVIVHAFCNWMGLPRLWGRVRPNEQYAASPVLVRGKEDLDSTSRRSRSEEDAPIIYTVVYYVLLLAGILAFRYCLFPLTNGADALAKFDIQTFLPDS